MWYSHPELSIDRKDPGRLVPIFEQLQIEVKVVRGMLGIFSQDSDTHNCLLESFAYHSCTCF